MPPRRKSTIASPTSSMAPKPSAISGLSTGSNKPSAQGGSKSRLAPSIPFQMQTRRGAKSASDHQNPAGPFSASSESRRTSLNHIQPLGDASLEIEHARPAKRCRTLSNSGSSQMSHGTLDNNHSMNGTQEDELQKPASGDTLPASRSTIKRRRASEDSAYSSKTFSAPPNGVLTRAHSDVSNQPSTKKRRTAEMPADSVDPPELTDASTAPNSPEAIPDVDSVQGLQNVLPINGDAPAKAGRRLPGRRRQPHSDMNVEIDLRRQLNLKMSYRSLAKVQKALLQELSSRSVGNLEKDTNFHADCPEYEPLMASLHRYHDSRLDQINALQTCKLEQIERICTAEKHIQKQQYINRFRELQDDFLLQCYIRAKRIERELKGVEADATEDEDNILPPTYTDEPHHNVDDRIGSKYASRSRAYIEADKVLESESVRRRFDQARAAFVERDEDADDSIDDAETGGFARFTGPDRTEAIAHYNLTNLADAAIEVERPPPPQPELEKIPVIPNEQASLLMMLADMSEQHSQPATSQNQQLPSPPRQTTPAIKTEVVQMSPRFSPPDGTVMPAMQIMQPSPIRSILPPINQIHRTPPSRVNSISTALSPEATCSATPARTTTHRIMDILNNDPEVPVLRPRDGLPTHEPNTPSRRNTMSQHNTPMQTTFPADPFGQRAERSVDQSLTDPLRGPLPPARSFRPSPSAPSHPWSATQSATTSETENVLRRRDPSIKLRKLLDSKYREQGKEAPPQGEHWGDFSRFRQPSMVHAPEHDRPGLVPHDPFRPVGVGHCAASTTATKFADAARRGSQDQTHYWDQDRRMSIPQAHPPGTLPYPGTTLPQLGPTSPGGYAHPPGSLPLPPKSAGQPPASTINYRFAHYDPAPRSAFPPPSPSYPPAQSGPPTPIQPYTSTYAATPLYTGYVPPPGSFQAPPLPPPPLAATPAYPPLKIHQYGGTPILPATMAPPPPNGTPMTFVGQAAPGSAYSPTSSGPPGPPVYEQRAPGAETGPPGEGGARPRRQYRSYHAPGTQFRSYQGPGEARRRGG